MSSTSLELLVCKGVFLNWIQIKVKVVKQVKGPVNSSPSIKCFQTIKDSFCKGYDEFIQ